MPSSRSLSSQAAQVGTPLSHTTIADIVKGSRPPALKLALLIGGLVDADQRLIRQLWLEAYDSE